MAIQLLMSIMERIECANDQSPIAVFKITVQGKTYLESVFANTVLTQRRIKRRDPRLVGIFHKKMNTNSVMTKLTNALSEEKGLVL